MKRSLPAQGERHVIASPAHPVFALRTGAKKEPCPTSSRRRGGFSNTVFSIACKDVWHVQTFLQALCEPPIPTLKSVLPPSYPVLRHFKTTRKGSPFFNYGPAPRATSTWARRHASAIGQKTTNMTTAVATKKAETVRASINERKFFEMQGQLYKSSFSFLGELMQNARRAGSSAVWFHLDKDKAQLICRDEGCGVENFQNLVELATSGWQDEKIQLSDKPFGMGLFSLFYACDRVTIRSRGKILQITQDDVIQRREIEVRADEDKVRKGTTIILDGLNPKLLEDGRQCFTDTSGLFKMALPAELRNRAVGFEIPVHLNEVTLDRPFARDNLKGEATRIGWVSIPGIHSSGTLSQSPEKPVGYFLQGLPIESAPTHRMVPRTIVHLDSEQFIPVMPDRATLQDASTQTAKVDAVIKEIFQRFLVQEKTRLSSEEFVKTYFDHVIAAGLKEILNDIPCIPAGELVVVSSIDYSTRETWTRAPSPTGSVIHRKDLLEGGKIVWRNAPDNAISCEFAVAILKVMERNDIATLMHESHFDKGHWINQCAPDASEFVVQVEPGKELSRGDYVDSCRAESCEARMVDAFTISITSRVDPTWSHVEVIDNDWVLVPQEPTDDQDGDADGDLIYYFTATDVSRSNPWRSLSDFEDDTDTYREEWEDNSRDDWNAKIAAIKGQPLVNAVATALNKATESPNHRQIDQVAIVRSASRWHNWDGSVSHHFDAVNPDAEFWTKMATELEQCQDGNMAERLKAAFTAVIRPGELQLDESATSHLVSAAGFNVLKGVLPSSWYVLLPGEKSADFEAENHNYLGFFNSKEDAVAEAYDAVVETVGKALGTSPEVFAALDLPSQWKQVKAAYKQNQK